MPKRDVAPNGAPCWIDLLTTNPDASQEFYGQLFGWTSEAAGEEFGGYITFSLDGVAVAGGMKNDGSSGAPDLWTIYLVTDDADKTVALATENGGQVLLPTMVIGEPGSMAMVADPGGAAIGVWQPNVHKGFGVLGEHGAPSWFELHTRDYDRSIEFYRAVFDWTTHAAADEPDFRYTVKLDGDEQQAGVMDASAWLPEGVPNHWSVYFHTDDADRSLAKAVELGGAVVVPVEDTPYGRLATLTDVTGATFKLQQPV